MIAKSAEDKLKELTSSARSMTEVLIQAESSNISLSSRLSAYRKESGNRRPDFAKAYDELVERLNAIDRGQVGPPLGEFMPEFDLPDEKRTAHVALILAPIWAGRDQYQPRPLVPLL